MVQHTQSMNVINYINGLKYKNHTIISVDACLHDKSSRECRARGTYLNIMKSICETHSQWFPNWRKIWCNLIEVRKRHGCLLIHSFWHCAWSSSWSNTTKEGNKRDTNREGSQIISICRWQMYDDFSLYINI